MMTMMMISVVALLVIEQIQLHSLIDLNSMLMTINFAAAEMTFERHLM